MVLWEGTNGPMNLDEIRIIERELNVIFPDEFVTCVLANDGGHPVPNHFNTMTKKNEFHHLEFILLSLF